jgi:hypothetical protein
MKYLVLLTMLILPGCKEYYEPPALKNTPHYLVVDGILTNSPDSTYITLTYTRSLQDTAPSSPELNATIVVEGDKNTMITLPEIGMGRYGNLLNLNVSEHYRLNIITSDGRKYSSEYVPYRQTPPIDTLSWTQDSSEVNFYLDTHDPQNNTRYYRWRYEETWEYSTYLTSNFDYVHDHPISRSTIAGKQIMPERFF